MKKLLDNQYIFSLITKGVLVILGILSSVFINRYLGPSLRGEYAYTLNIINITVLILNLGIYQSYPYFRRKNSVDIKEKYFNIVLQQFIMYMLIGTFLSIFFSNLQLTIIFTLTPLMILTTQLNFVALIENINLRNKLNIGNQIFYIFLLLIVFLFMPQNILFVFIALYVKDIVIITRIIKKYGFKVSLKKFEIKLMIETIKFGVFPMLSALLITMNYNIDIIMLKFFVDFKNIGYYSVGVALANQVWLIPDAFKDVLFSKTAKSDAIEDIKLSIKTNLYVSAVIIFLIVFWGRAVLTILYGIEYLPAYSVTVLILTGLIPMIFYKMIISLFNAKGMQKLSFGILFASVILNIGSNLMLIPIYGILGAAFSSVLSYTLCGVLFTYIFMREFKVKFKQLLLFDKNEIGRLKGFYQKADI
jgi:O-antigen/teichoic acid export membrane protein